MSRRQNSDLLKNTFPFPNEIFILGLCPGELAVYSYLLCCANRKTGQCWPSYKAIGKAVGMTENTVAKYVASLERKDLIRTEPTTVTTKAGIKRNGNLLYTGGCPSAADRSTEPVFWQLKRVRVYAGTD